jgi:hypothetical protein
MQNTSNPTRVEMADPVGEMPPVDRSSQRWNLRFISLIVVLGTVGIADYLTGYEVSFAMFYLVPVAGAAWFVSRRAGLLIAALAAVTWMIADKAGGHIYSNPFFFWWNGVNRLAIGVAVAIFGNALHARIDEQRRLIFGLRRALLTLSELSAQIPVCPICSRLRDDQEYRASLQQFLATHHDPRSLGRSCPACIAVRQKQFAASDAERDKAAAPPPRT